MASIHRIVRSWQPTSVAPMSRRNFRRELLSALLFSPTQALIEGSVIGLIAKITYTGTVEKHTLNVVVALLTATPEFA
ncbi:MAG: hypothetical protein IT437_08665, partial [Phycisphaerales bacterium]|nr:hypothetical protein [Phycisphaerales bacterium]